MAIKMNFNLVNVPENPTLILANRKGNKSGIINAQDIVVKDNMTDGAELSFAINKYTNGKKEYLWDSIKDYKLIWYKEADLWFQIKVDIEETINPQKKVSCIQLSHAELSQIMLYDIQINTEEDIQREDYSPTVLYNHNNHSASLLHRITEKAPHYQIYHVDATIAGIQRTFSFDNKSIYDACLEIAEEIGCIFIFHSDSNADGSIRRGISVYDLQTYCTNCGERGDFIHACSACGSAGLINGYGEDTTIFVTADELGKDIKFTSDTNSQKNCFKLEAGDDLMTATVRQCNPNGTDYIWYIPNYIKEDMSDELVQKIDQYESIYNYYKNSHSIPLNTYLTRKYNTLVDKYITQKPDLIHIPSEIITFKNFNIIYYQCIDFEMYLKSDMMPTIEILQTTAANEISKLNPTSISPVSVANIANISLSSANSAVLSVAKCLINSNYKIKIVTSSLNGTIWTGSFYVENYSDENDKATSNNISITIDSDYENFVKQKIKKALSQGSSEKVDVIGLFSKSLSVFKNELKKYNLDSLNDFYNMCQTCVDILVEQGIGKDESWSGDDLYTSLYMNYYNKLKSIADEQSIRQSELEIIVGEYENEVLIPNTGIQSMLNEIRQEIQQALNFENFLGNDLWLEFCAYKREDKYSNSNFVSDGLNSAEIFNKALEFIDKANKELYTSAELQHSISASLANLLLIPKFRVLTQHFKTGNWLRILVDNTVYKLRLLSYEIDYKNLDSIQVEFSDVQKTYDGYSDQRSLVKSMSSMSTSYGYTQHQAEQGLKSNRTISNWVKKGLDVTGSKIINGASSQTQIWDEHGILCRQYNDVVNEYDKCQLKIINSTIAITDDEWLHVKTAIGKFYYIDPQTNEITYTYGINAETVVGKLILGEQLGIYNTSGSLKFDQNGLSVKNSKNYFNVNPNSNKLISLGRYTGELDSNNENITEEILSVDNNGVLTLRGNGANLDLSSNSTVKIAWNNISRYIQFENGEFRIYNSSNNLLMNVTSSGMNIFDGLSSTAQSENLTMKLNSSGINYYLGSETIDGATVSRKLGYIGTGAWGSELMRGIVFRLNHVEGGNTPSEGRYMAWGYQEQSDGGFVVKMAYLANSYGNNEKGMHFMSDNVYFETDAHFLNDLYLRSGSRIHINDYVDIIKYSSGDAGLRSYTNNTFISGNTATVASITNNNGSVANVKWLTVTSNAIECHGNLDLLNTYSVINSSDERLKTNIKKTKVNALDLINQIELKEFDWIEDNKHENIGVIAQQLKEFLPDVIYEDEETTKMSIQPLKFIPYLIKAIQELSNKIDADKSKTNRSISEITDIPLKEKMNFIKSIKRDEPISQIEEKKTKTRLKLEIK